MQPPSLRFLTDEQLLAQSRVEALRSGGPGGQKRNKTASAVRITHIATGLQGLSSDWRKQTENRLWAMRRLRLKLAVEIREPVELSRFEPPDWFLALRHNRQIGASHRHEHYAATCGLILDLLAVMGGNPSTVATMLGVTTTAVVKLVEAEPTLWTETNRLRQIAGLKPLVHRH